LLTVWKRGLDSRTQPEYDTILLVFSQSRETSGEGRDIENNLGKKPSITKPVYCPGERRRIMVRKIWVVLFLLSLIFACSSCSGSEVAGTENGVYNRYNIHYFSKKNSNTASYANYTQCPGHSFLPYNTKFKVGNWDKGFKLTDVNAGLVIVFEYSSANMGGMSANDYINLIMSQTPVSYEGLSAKDKEGVKAGQALPGMSKQGVMIALGYPAKHRTPSIDLNTWLYWKGRFNMLEVGFNDEGKVISVR
jgi:hypothetical protein